MSERIRTTKKRARKQTREESFEAGVEAMYHRSRGHLVALAKAENKGTPEWQKNVALATNTAGAAAGPAAIYMAVRQARGKKGGMPRQATEAVEAKSKPTTRIGRASRATGKVLRNPKAIAAGGAVAIGAQVANTSGDVIAARFLAEDKKKGKAMSNVNKRMSAEEKATLIAGGTVGGVLGGAAGAFGGNQLDRLGMRAGAKGGGLDFVDAQGKPNLAMVNRKGVYQLRAHNRGKKLKGSLKRNRFALGGAALGGLAGLMSGINEANETNYMMRKSIEQSLISKSDAVVITGHGNSLIEKRSFNAEADRQRRLGLYAGAGLGAGAVLGDAARRRMPRVEEELKDGRKIKRFDMPKGRRGRLTLAALAGGAALGAGGGASAYRRGISERNNSYL